MSRNYRGWRKSWWRRIEDSLAGLVSMIVQTLMMPIIYLRQLQRWVFSFATGFRRRSARTNWLLVIVALIFRPLVETGRLLRWVLDLIIGWWPQAQWRFLFQGTPAILFAGLATIPIVGQSSTKDTQQYYEAARDAFERKQYSAAEVYYRALVQLQPKNEVFRYNMAKTLEAENKFEEAMAIMSGLAPRDAQGFAPAHLWQAVRLLRDPSGGSANVELAEAHLLRAVRGRGQVATDAHAFLGQLYLASGRLKQAEEHFSAAASGRPELWIALARVHVLQGQRDQGRRDAEKALEYYSNLEEADLDNHEARLFAAEALTFLERFSDAAMVLDKGAKISADPRYPVALGRVYLTWAESLRRLPQAKMADHQALLIRSFEYDPTSKLLLRRLINGLKADGAEAEIVRGVVRAALGRNRNLDVVNVLLAIDAADRGELDSAQTYLNRARQVNPRVPRLMSEMAHSYVDFPPASVPQAMALADLGLKIWPDDPDLRYCRGDLYARNGQWFDALMDLEAAVKSKPDDRNAHRLIGEVYQQLGMPEKAAEHFRRFQQIK
ncbi:MAG TPA: tetratricopeptide repeat protein [Pirellulales bacterium]|nr:tetratricopeptide repeat protein [Pirellulales bacterium]